MTERPRILIFATKTGGGHWSPALAIADEIQRLTEGRIDVQVVDGLYGESGIGLIVERGYSLLIRRARLLWGSFFTITNHRLPLYLNNTLLYRIMKKIRATLYDGPRPLAVVCTNSIILRPIGKVLKMEPQSIPFVNVVTDLVTVHRAWADRTADLILSPAPMATQALVGLRQSPYKILETGLPVSRDFHPVSASEKDEIRQTLELDPQRPVILMMYGAEGHQRLEQMTLLMQEKFGPSLQLVVVCGKNEALKEKLDAYAFGPAVRILGFTREVHRYMKAADLLITKAGSLTVSEALACGCPMMISEHLPGQESGTSEWLAENGAAVIAHGLSRIGEELETLLREPEKLERMGVQAYKLGRPGAALQAAQAILGLCHGSQANLPLQPGMTGALGFRYSTPLDPLNGPN